ncbi:hypothetical protein SATRI_v1c01880 [Spiroplasma atrichopogonis]|nr:hypothetical protein SATRI_v1c01880 [Spiroplasma atrichopogonis]
MDAWLVLFPFILWSVISNIVVFIILILFNIIIINYNKKIDFFNYDTRQKYTKKVNKIIIYKNIYLKYIFWGILINCLANFVIYLGIFIVLMILSNSLNKIKNGFLFWDAIKIFINKLGNYKFVIFHLPGSIIWTISLITIIIFCLNNWLRNKT